MKFEWIESFITSHLGYLAYVGRASTIIQGIPVLAITSNATWFVYDNQVKVKI